MDEELERIKQEKVKRMVEEAKKVEIEVKDADFEKEVIEKSKKVPVVVDFWGPWCMPCNMLSPVLEKLAKEYEGKFILAKVNVDEARTATQTYGVMSIPAVKMFKDGKIVDEFVGLLPEQEVKDWLDKNL